MVQRISSKADGTSIGVELHGSGTGCLIVHGTTSEKSRWMDFIERQSSSCKLISYDRRGRGDSDDQIEYSIEKEFEDLVSILESLEEPVNILGHSSGAIIALEASAKIPDRVIKLALYEPPIPTGIPLYDENILRNIEKHIEDGNKEKALLVFYENVVKMPNADIEELRTSPLWNARVDLAHTIPREIMGFGKYRFDKSQFENFKPETLLLKGGDSPQIFHQAIDLLSSTLPGNQVFTMEGEQHLAMYTNPRVFDDAVMNFFEILN